MAYTVSCACGLTLSVEATQAGTTINCPGCQSIVKVPRMSALRTAAGESAIPLNSAERVNQAVKEDRLPSNSLCPITGGKADAIAVFRIHCERTWKKGQDPSMLQYAFWFFLLGWIGLLFAFFRGKGEKEVLGRDTFVDAPVRVAREVLLELSRQKSQRELRRLLSNTPEYAAVFEEFPKSQISFVASAGEGKA